MGQLTGGLEELVLAGDRLVLRPWRDSDVPAVAAVMADRRMHEFAVRPDPYTLEHAAELVHKYLSGGRIDGTALNCAIEERDSGRFVGSAEVRLPHAHQFAGSVGYWIDPAAQGRGYAGEAARMLGDWAIDRGLQRVEIRAAVRNLASVRVAALAGFRFEGILRADARTRRGPEDAAVFARVPGDSGAPIPPWLPHPDGLGDVGFRLPTAQDAAGPAGDVVHRMAGLPPGTLDASDVEARARLGWLVGPVTVLAVAGDPLHCVTVHRLDQGLLVTGPDHAQADRFAGWLRTLRPDCEIAVLGP